MSNGSSEWPLMPSGQPPRVVPPTAPGYSTDDRLTLTAMWSTERREGQWLIPPYLWVSPSLSNVYLNCLRAVPAAPVIDLFVNGGMGSVILVVPDGWGVDTNHLGKGIGSVKNQVGSNPVPGAPLFVVGGSIALGTFKARHANWLDLKRLQWVERRRALGGGPSKITDGGPSLR